MLAPCRRLTPATRRLPSGTRAGRAAAPRGGGGGAGGAGGGARARGGGQAGPAQPAAAPACQELPQPQPVSCEPSPAGVSSRPPLNSTPHNEPRRPHHGRRLRPALSPPRTDPHCTYTVHLFPPTPSAPCSSCSLSRYRFCSSPLWDSAQELLEGRAGEASPLCARRGVSAGASTHRQGLRSSGGGRAAPGAGEPACRRTRARHHADVSGGAAGSRTLDRLRTLGHRRLFALPARPATVLCRLEALPLLTRDPPSPRCELPQVRWP